MTDDDSHELEQRPNDCNCCSCKAVYEYDVETAMHVYSHTTLDEQCRSHGNHGMRACADHTAMAIRCGQNNCDNPDTCDGNTQAGLAPRLKG